MNESRIKSFVDVQQSGTVCDTLLHPPALQLEGACPLFFSCSFNGDKNIVECKCKRSSQRSWLVVEGGHTEQKLAGF